MFRLSEYVAQTNAAAPHHFKPYTLPGRTSSVTAKGYTGEAARSGYGSYFGDRERQWQQYEFQRKHQAGPDAQPGASYVILADKDGTGAAGLTAEIGGRLCTSGENGKIRLLDTSYYNKVAETLKEQREHCQKITGMCLQSSDLTKAMFPHIEDYFAPHEFTDAQKANYIQRLTNQTTDTGEAALNYMASSGVPTALVGVSCDPDHLNSLSPYSAIYSDGVAKLMCIIRNQNVAFVGEIEDSNPMEVSTEDKKRLATQQKTKSVDVS